MFHKRFLLGIVCGLGCLAVGCGPPRAGTSPEPLVGAKYDIPVYPGARVVSRKSMLFQKEGRAGEVSSFDTVTWKLETSDPVERVIDYYESRLPDAQHAATQIADNDAGDEPEESTKRFEYVPSNAQDGDSVVISIGEDGLEIAQITRRE